MIGVKFVARCPKTKNKMYSSKLYFNNLEESTLMLIQAQRINLQTRLPDHTILTLIVNEESVNDIHLSPRT